MNQATMQDLGRLLLRLAVGVLVLLHGLAKLRTGVRGIERMVDSLLYTSPSPRDRQKSRMPSSA